MGAIGHVVAHDGRVFWVRKVTIGYRRLPWVTVSDAGSRRWVEKLNDGRRFVAHKAAIAGRAWRGDRSGGEHGFGRPAERRFVRTFE